LSGQKQSKQSPQERGAHAKAREDISQKDRKSAAAAPALTAIGAKDALTSDMLVVVIAIGVVAIKNAVAIERVGAMAKGTTTMLEGQKPELQSLNISKEP
jgi:hypothetical protein